MSEITGGSNRQMIRTTNRSAHETRDWADLGARIFSALLGMFALCLLELICDTRADRLVRVLRKSGTEVLTRPSAFILLAIGVQIIWDGLKIGIPQLFSFLIAHRAG